MEKENDMIKKIETGNLLLLMEEVLRNNKYEFDYQEAKYRIRNPYPKEKQEAYRKSMEFNLKLLEDSSQKTAEQIIEIHKKRGLDLNKVSSEINRLEEEKEKFEVDLGELVKKEASQEQRDIIENKIKSLLEQITDLRNKKIDKLRFSIESQTNDYYTSYLTFLILEKIIKEEGKEDKFEKVYKTYEEYEMGDEGLIAIAAFHVAVLVNRNAFGK